MDKQRILKEAQKIAAKFSFWMVSGNIAHLYGYAYETPENKYELEIKFPEEFPISPPQLIFKDAIKELLGEFQLEKLQSWDPNLGVVDIIHELKAKIQEVLNEPIIVEEQLIPIHDPEVQYSPTSSSPTLPQSTSSEEYLTPDANYYPDDYNNSYNQEYVTPQLNQTDIFITPDQNYSEPSTLGDSPQEQGGEYYGEFDEGSVIVNTELGLIQQYYAYDHKGRNKADINIYLTITVSKTFIIGINFSNYPEIPRITFPEEIIQIFGNPIQSIEVLRKWNPKKPPHIINIFTELEKRLYFIKDVEEQSKLILGEYQCDKVVGNASALTVHLLTYGFKEYLLEVDLASYPKPPTISLTSELQQIIEVPITGLNYYKNWKEQESKPLELIREISWLVDKNSRIKFDIELLKEHYKEIQYNSEAETIRIDMKGKMKTQDLTFEFQIHLPREYPMKVPDIKVLNEFDIDIHEKVKNDLQASFKDFFTEWTPFSYLIDLFKVISEKIFEVSLTSCVICHKIECPSCSKSIGGSDACHMECPYCERSYHAHCWEQTLKSFGKCGFCLRTPPPSAF